MKMIRNKKRIFGNVMAMFSSLLLLLFILEFVVRMISPPNIFHPLLRLSPKNKMKLNVNLKGVSSEAFNTTNQWGMRGDEPPSDWNNYYTIVTIGGSATQCFYLDDHKTWPYLLQEKLKKKYPKVWVGNGGLDGHTTRGHIVFMNSVIPKIRPKAVMLLAGINDLGLSINADDRLYGSFFERTNWKRWIFANSRLIQILYIWKVIILNNVTVIKQNMHDGFEPKPLRDNLLPLPDDLILLLPSLEEFRKNIIEIIRIGKSLNIRMIFITQPMLFDDTEYWRKIEGQFYWIKNTKYTLSVAIYWRLLDIFNKELLTICRLQNIEYFDLASAVPHSDLYFYDSAHFNEQGAELVAEKIAAFLLKSKIFEDKVTALKNHN